MPIANNASISIGGNSGFQSIGSGDSITNKIILNNYSEDPDLITLINSNFDSANSNITINFDNQYRLGLINSNIQFVKYNNDDVLIDIDDNNIIINNNIINNINDTYSINNNDDTILFIDKNNRNINFSNYNYNFNINDNVFNILNTSNGSNIIKIDSSTINIENTLNVGQIYVDKISPMPGAIAVTIEGLHMTSNNFTTISLGDTLNGIDDTSLKINTNNLNNSLNLLEINKNYDTILKIDNYGYINMGNCDNNNINSYINIDNSNYNLHTDYLSFKGHYYSDALKIDKYANITIGQNNNNNFGILDINRNDVRINLDDTNAHNVNVDKPLLNLNIEYETSNNYVWEKSNTEKQFFNIFPLQEENDLDNTNETYNYINNYMFKFASVKAEHTTWEKFNNTSGYYLIDNTTLKSYLDTKYSNTPDIINIPNDEWSAFQINDLKINNYILFNGYYYRPYRLSQYNNRMYYQYDNEYYFFLHSQYINGKLDFDYTKLKLLVNNNKTPELESGNTGYNLFIQGTYNILYNTNNLQHNTDQIEYDFKTLMWENETKTTVSYKILYPDKIVYNGIIEELKLEDITLSLSRRMDVTQPITSGTWPMSFQSGRHLFMHILNAGGGGDASLIQQDKLITILAGWGDEEVRARYFQTYTSIRHIEIRASGLWWKKVAFSRIDDETPSTAVDFDWGQSNLDYTSNLHNMETSKHLNTRIATKLDDFFRLLTDNGNNLYSLTQAELDTLDIGDIYCNEYITDVNDPDNYYIPEEQIKPLFTIHLPIAYRNANQDQQIVKDYTSDIIQKPDFINLTYNEQSMLNINNYGSLIYDNDTYNEISNYSIYAPNRPISADSIELNTISSSMPNKYINFNKSYLDNIAGINFNSDQEFTISKLKVDTLSNDNNLLLFDNACIELITNKADIVLNSNLLLFDTENNFNYGELYYNSIIFIDTHNNTNIKPAITVYGNSPSLNLKSNKINDIFYQQTISQKSFAFFPTSSKTQVIENDVFQINYYDNIDGLFDEHFNTNNSKHIIEHITGEYNILSFGENYNICIDTKGITEGTFSDNSFGIIWEKDDSPHMDSFQITGDFSNQIINAFDKQSSPELHPDTIKITDQDFISILPQNRPDLNEKSYVVYNHFKYKPYIRTYSYNLARKSTNKNHKISLGVPHNNHRINTSISSSADGVYLYNYPRYFNEIIKDNNYMLNIFGNTKICGIDGDTNALSIIINDEKSLDDTFKVNLGIGTEPLINDSSNTLLINGDIFADNLFYKNNSDYSNISNIYTDIIDTVTNTIFREQLNISVIHTSNINSNFTDDTGIFNLNLIPNIPISKFSKPSQNLDEIQDSPGILQYNWSDEAWQLNYSFNQILTEIDDIYINSNILDNKIENFSNIIDITSNSIFGYIIDCNTDIYNNISTINDNINELDSNISNYVKSTHDDIIEIDRIPKIPFTKFSNLDINFIYSPKVDNDIIVDTNYYSSNILYDPQNGANNTYYEYIILTHDNDAGSSSTTHNLEFQIGTNIDVLIVGGGGGGNGGNDYTGGGGGGGTIFLKEFDVELNTNYVITVGSGGSGGSSGSGGFSGTASVAFGLTAEGGGGGGGDSSDPGTGGFGGTCVTTSEANIYSYDGGQGGAVSSSVKEPPTRNISDLHSSADFINDSVHDKYYWGGGGGFGLSTLFISDLHKVPHGGVGGGGAGVFNTSILSLFAYNGYSYGVHQERGQINGALNSGGGGGGGGEDFVGGSGGSGVVIIKINSTTEPSEPDKKKAYVSYNFNSARWEMTSLDLLDIDINSEEIDSNIVNTSNQLITYIDAAVSDAEAARQVYVSSNQAFTNYNIISGAIESHNIFGHNGRAVPLRIEDQSLVGGDGLIEINADGYSNADSPYYRNLIHGDKFDNGSITNNNIANNSIPSDKLYGKITGNKLRNVSIDYSNIDFIGGTHIDGAKITNDNQIPIDIGLFDNIIIDSFSTTLSTGQNYNGLTTISSQQTGDKIRIQQFSNINIDISDIDLALPFNGTTYITSASNDIDINQFQSIEIDISNIYNPGDGSFIINNAIINGVIPEGMIHNAIVHTNNLSGTSLIGTDVQFSGTAKIPSAYIETLTLSASQIEHDHSITINTILSGDEKINPSLIGLITLTPDQIEIGSGVISNVIINTTIGTSRIDPSLIGEITLTPDQIEIGSGVISNVIINTTIGTTLIDPSLIGEITLKPDQIEIGSGVISNVIIDTTTGTLIDPSLIASSVTIDGSMLKVGDKPDGGTYKLSDNLTYNFPMGSIDPSLIPANINISGSSINDASGNKLSGVNITGTIDSFVIGDGPTITSGANITGNHKISDVQIECSVAASNIDSAVITHDSTVIGNGRINYAVIRGTINPISIDNSLIVIDTQGPAGTLTTFDEGKFSGTTEIKGEINATNVNNAIINLGHDTSFLAGSQFSGDVTITGIVDASLISTPVSLNITGANLNGSNIIDNSIKSIKLDSNLSLSCDSITFSDKSILASVTDLYTRSEAETNLLSISSNNFLNWSKSFDTISSSSSVDCP